MAAEMRPGVKTCGAGTAGDGGSEDEGPQQTPAVSARLFVLLGDVARTNGSP